MTKTTQRTAFFAPFTAPYRIRLMTLLTGSCMLAFSMPMMADASSLIPDEPSIEVHLEALDALRPSAAFNPQSGTVGVGGVDYNGAPFAVGASVPGPSDSGTKPRYNSGYRQPSKALAKTKVAPVKQVPKIAQATPIAQPVISSQNASPQPSGETMLAPQKATPKLPPPPPLQSAEVRTKASETLQPIVTPPVKKNTANTQESKNPTSAVAALTQATQPELLPLPEPSSARISNAAPEKTVADIPNANASKVTSVPEAKPSAPSDSLAPSTTPNISQLDFSKLGKPVVPAAQTASSIIAANAKPQTITDANTKKIEPEKPVETLSGIVPSQQDKTAVASIPQLPVLEPIPAKKPPLDLQKTPEAKQMIEQSTPGVLSQIKSANTPVAPVLVADNAAKDALPNPKPQAPDPALKNLSDRMNSLFVKTPDKQGVVSDKIAVTGPLQNLPELPKAGEPERHLAEKPKQLSLAEVNKLDPPESLSKKDPLGLPDAIPALPEVPAIKPVLNDKSAVHLSTDVAKVSSGSVPAKPSVVDALSKAVANAPTIPTAPVITANVAPAKIESSAPKLDFSALKPPVQSAPTSGATLPAKPILGAPQTVEKKPASIVPKTVPTTPPVKPSSEKPVLPTIPNAPARAVSSADDLASLLPPPSKASVPASTNNLPNLSAITNRASDVRDTNAALPSLASITGDTGRSSLDIVRDEQGVRTTSLAPPASLPPSLPDNSATSDLPKVTRGEKKVEVKAATPPLAQKPVPPSASQPKTGEEKATPVINTTVVASPAVPKLPAADSQNTQKSPSILQASAPKPASIARTSEAPAAKVVAAKLSIPFEKDKVDVQQTMQAKIADVASSAKSNGKNIRIVAYASGKADETSAARRVSLSRALQVRAALINKGVDPMKITVQALGNTGNNGDRADIVVN